MIIEAGNYFNLQHSARVSEIKKTLIPLLPFKKFYACLDKNRCIFNVVLLIFSY